MAAGSPVELRTNPVACNSHATLDRTQLVRAPKRSPSDAFANDVRRATHRIDQAQE